MSNRTLPRGRGHCVPLSPRAAFRRTFGGIAVFVSIPLLGFGAYLIKDQFENPVGSQPAGLLIAAVLIATALVLLSYVIYPLGAREARVDAMESEEHPGRGPTIEVSVAAPVVLQGERFDVPVHNRYLDRADTPATVHARGMAGK